MRLVILNTRGGPGKSSTATNAAYYFKVPLVSCDPRADYPNYLEHLNIKVAPITEPIRILDHAVYDLGGFSDWRTDELLKQADIVLIPFDDDHESMQGAVEAYQQAMAAGTKAFFVVNKITRSSSKYAWGGIASALMEPFFDAFGDVPFGWVRFSTAVKTCWRLSTPVLHSGDSRHKEIKADYKRLFKLVKEAIDVDKKKT